MKVNDKWAPAAEMVRALRALEDALEEAGLLTDALKARADNARYAFLETCPVKVYEEVLHG